MDTMLADAEKIFSQKPTQGTIAYSMMGPIESKFCIFNYNVAGGTLQLMTEAGLYGGGQGKLACFKFNDKGAATDRLTMWLDKVSWFSATVSAKREKYFEEKAKQKLQPSAAPEDSGLGGAAPA